MVLILWGFFYPHWMIILLKAKSEPPGRGNHNAINLHKNVTNMLFMHTLAMYLQIWFLYSFLSFYFVSIPFHFGIFTFNCSLFCLILIWTIWIFLSKDILTNVLFCLWFRYSSNKYLSIFLVSVGIFICTIMSAKQVVSTLTDVLPSFFWVV